MTEIFNANNFAIDLILILAIASTLKFEKNTSLIISFILGIIADFSSGLLVGPQAAGYVLASIITQIFSKNVFSEGYFSIAMISAGSVIAKEIFSNLIITMFSPNDDFLSRLYFVFSILPQEIILTIIIYPFCLKFLVKKALTNP